MKKILRGVLSLLLVLSMCACTSKSNLSVDDAFYEDLKQGLINRWKLSDLNDDDYTTEDFNGYVKAELDCISKYKNKKFKNKNIEKYAKEYIETFYDTKNNTKYIDSNYDKWESEYINVIYDDRCEALVHLNEIKKIEFDKKSQNKNFNELLDDGNDSLAIRDFMDKADFKKEPDEYEGETYHTYSMIMENTTDLSFDYFYFNLNLEDENGVVLETQSAYTDNWDTGTKHKFEFSTDCNFAKITVHDVSYDY